MSSLLTRTAQVSEREYARSPFLSAAPDEPLVSRRARDSNIRRVAAHAPYYTLGEGIYATLRKHSMNISLRPELERFLHDRVQSGRYHSMEEAVSEPCNCSN